MAIEAMWSHVKALPSTFRHLSSTSSVTVTITLVTFSGLVADGQLDFFCDYGTGGQNIDPFDPAEVRVQLEARDPAVPEPGTIFLFNSGLTGLAAWRYRKHTIKI